MWQPNNMNVIVIVKVTPPPEKSNSYNFFFPWKVIVILNAQWANSVRGSRLKSQKFGLRCKRHLYDYRQHTASNILVWRAFGCKNIFSNLVTKSADICKNAVLPEKSKLLEKIQHLEKFKNFFSWIQGLHRCKQFSDSKIIMQPF